MGAAPRIPALCLPPAGQHVLLGLRFQELSWDHTSPEEEESVLWLEFDGDSEGTPVNRLLKIYSKQVVGVVCAGTRSGWGPGGSRLAHKEAAEGLGTRVGRSHPCESEATLGLWPCEQPASAPCPLGVGRSQRRSRRGRAKAPQRLCFSPCTQPPPLHLPAASPAASALPHPMHRCLSCPSSVPSTA